MGGYAPSGYIRPYKYDMRLLVAAVALLVVSVNGTPPASCTALASDAASGVYNLSRADGSTYTAYCDRQGSTMWTVLFRFDESVSRDALFDDYMPRAHFQNLGEATSGTGTYARNLPPSDGVITEVAVACYDSSMSLLSGTFRSMAASEWIATRVLITGEESLNSSNRQQSNVFGFTNGYETLLHASPSDWRELNLIDMSDNNPSSTYGNGYAVWRSGSSSDTNAECGFVDAAISTNNQLALLVKTAHLPVIDAPADTSSCAGLPAGSASGVYRLVRADGATTYTAFCEAMINRVPWTVVFRFDGVTPMDSSGSLDRTSLFDVYMTAAKLQNVGDAAGTVGTYARSMPADDFDMVGIGCYDDSMSLIPGTFLSMSADDFPSFLISGDEDLTRSNGKVLNAFGLTNGSETLLWASSSDWRELNLLDTSDNLAQSTFGKGYVVWKAGTDNHKTGGCAGNPVSRSNQLVLMVQKKYRRANLGGSAATGSAGCGQFVLTEDGSCHVYPSGASRLVLHGRPPA